MSLKCEVGAVNGLCCHFSKWPSYGSFSLAVGDRQLLSQQEKDELVCVMTAYACVCVCLCVAVGLWMKDVDRVQAKTKKHPS